MAVGTSDECAPLNRIDEPIAALKTAIRTANRKKRTNAVQLWSIYPRMYTDYTILQKLKKENEDTLEI